ncbi:MAG: amidohydrolase [Oscillospiraceae bacterium]|nr:amidohydrolase [Oscillospiraceae bacterium]
MYDYLFSDIMTLDGNVYVGVKDGKITYVGKTEPAERTSSVICGKDKLLLPGIVNAHTHIPMSAFRGWGDGNDLQTWLYDYIFPYEEKMDEKAAGICAAICLAEAIASGTTAILDMYSLYGGVAPVVADSGINANLSRGTTAFGDCYDFASCSGFTETKELVRDWHGHDNGRIMVDASIHAEYTSDERLWRPMAEYAAANKLGMHVHVSETRREHEECKQRHGKTPARLFADMGVFDTRAAAAHCVWIEDEDMRLMAELGVTAVHSPVSNLKLASGVARVPDMLKAGMNVALGTDGVSSNDNMDMFEEIKLASMLHRGVSLDPTITKTRDVLDIATVNGAKALGRNDTGRIEQGCWADLTVLDLDKPHFYPRHDMAALAAYAANSGDVCLTMSRGKVLYKDGEHMTIDIEKAKHDLENYVMPKVFG